MVENPYFQFPRCALAFSKTPTERLDAIISYGMVEAGSRLFQQLSADRQQEFINAQRRLGTLPEGFKTQIWWHRAAVYGAHAIGITFGNFAGTLQRHQTLGSFIATHVSRHGRDPFVRIKRRWVFDTRDGHGISYREFAVLCAIYSAIGDKELAIVTQNRIRRCALGFRTAAIMEAELANRTDGAMPLTARQLRDTIARLHRNKFFARCTVARRITYYSIRLDDDALRAKVLERRTYPEMFRAMQAAKDHMLTAAIAQRRRKSAQLSPPSASPKP
jgi:hypothetical protein